MNSAEMVELNTVSGNVSLSLQGMTAAEIYSVSGNIELYLNKKNRAGVKGGYFQPKGSGGVGGQ